MSPIPTTASNQYLILTSPGLAEVALQEAIEFGAVIKNKDHLIIQLSADKLNSYIQHAQAPTRIVSIFTQASTPESLDFTFATSLPPISTFNLEYDGVKGQDIRDNISKKILPQLFPILEAKMPDCKMDRKHPQLTLYIIKRESQTQSSTPTYYLALDLVGDIARREYRVFAHASSIRGDVAYRILREIEFTNSKKIFIGFVKDGVLAIEAAILAHNHSLNRTLPPLVSTILTQNNQIAQTSPINTANQGPKTTNSNSQICAFETSVPNTRAIDRNAHLAGVKSHLKIKKCALDDLDLHFEENTFDVVLFIITQKDEEKVNEMYHQALTLLKQNPSSKVTFLSREGWDLVIPDQLHLEKKVSIERGEGKSTLWIITHKPGKK